ncbi:MAG TPA: hypothetical protein VEU33_28315 [Archangium sp.]|nr:hypothetical protein [Archangium sp.]
MLNVVTTLAKNLKKAILADPKRFYSVDTGAWVTGLPKPDEIQVNTGREPLWINLGYWRDVERVDESTSPCSTAMNTSSPPPKSPEVPS